MKMLGENQFQNREELLQRLNTLEAENADLKRDLDHQAAILRAERFDRKQEQAENAELKKRVDELNTEVLREKRNAVDNYRRGAKMKAEEDASQIDVAVRATRDAHNLLELQLQENANLKARNDRLIYLLREGRKMMRGTEMSQTHIDIDAALADEEGK